MIELNKPAPSFSLADQSGKEHSLAQYKGKWVVLYFYPKDNTPGCTVEAIDFTAKKKDFEKLGAIVLGVSPDSEKSHCDFIEKQNLSITLLCDPARQALKAYGAWGKKMMYGKEVEGVIRSSCLIDPKGNVAFHWPKVKVEGHADQVLFQLKALQKN